MIDDKKIEEAYEEIFEDRFLLNGTDVVFDNDDNLQRGHQRSHRARC